MGANGCRVKASDRNIPHNNEEDWAARARAWASAKVAIENQHPLSQFAPVDRPEEHNLVYHDQYQQTVDPHYTDVRQSSLPTPSHQQFLASAANPHRSPVNHLQESTSFSSGPSSYVSDGHLSYIARDGVLAADSNPVYPRHESVPASSSVYQQEVPSSYSSVTGLKLYLESSAAYWPQVGITVACVSGTAKCTRLVGYCGCLVLRSGMFGGRFKLLVLLDLSVVLLCTLIAGKGEAGDQKEQLYKPSFLPISSAHVHPTHPAIGRSTSMEQPHFTYGDQSVESLIDPSDRPLEFASRFTHGHDPHPESSYSHPNLVGPVGSVDPIAGPSIHAWTSSVAPGVVYPPIPPIPSGQQFDPSFATSSPVSGQAAPVFGRIPGPSFRPTIPAVGAPFGLGAGAALHLTAAFPGDVNGGYNVSERPRKASVPNWLREEIIKKKTIIPSSVQEHPEEDHFQPIGDENTDKSLRKSYRTDSKNVDSSRSTEDDDDDEDDVEEAKIAAINQEIKRVLTEVLLKVVTDELFDEIATKVLSEDDLTVEVDHSSNASNHKVVQSPPSVPTPKASANVLIPVKAKETEAKDFSGKSSSSSPGDVLGLANYASDDDDAEEIDSSNVPKTRQTGAAHQQSSIQKLSEDIAEAVENGSSQAETEGHSGGQTNMESDLKTRPSGPIHNHIAVDVGLSDTGVDKELDLENDGSPSSVKGVFGNWGDKINVDSGKMVRGSNAFELKDTIGEMASMNPELLSRNVSIKRSMTDDSQGKEARIKSDKKDGHESNRSSAGKDFLKQVESGKVKVDEKHSDSNDHRRWDERHARKEKTNEMNGSKERVKEQGVKPGEKAKESDFRKKSIHVNSKDDRKESDRVKSSSAKEDSNRKRERVKDEKGDRLRHKVERDSSRHKRQRSSSVGSRGRNSKDNLVGGHASNSSDEASDDSKKRYTNTNLSLSFRLCSSSYSVAYCRKLRSKRRSLSPSPIRSRRRQVSRSPHSKHSQRRHSPYSSLEKTRSVAMAAGYWKKLICMSNSAMLCGKLEGRLNFSFYLACSNDATIAAMVKMENHAATSVLSEQPSFYEVVRYVQRESRRRKELGGASISLDLSLRPKDLTVRIVHAGGLVELYHDTIPAYQVMEKYPGMCLALPQVFKQPHESLVHPEEKLVPGQKFYLVPYTTVRKLKRRNPEKVTLKETEAEEVSGGITMVDVGGCNPEESVCSAKDFYASREKWSKCAHRRCGREEKKPFTPPIKKARMCQQLGWQPSLTSVQELSP
ncbi:hypothetical protein HHK36_025020 [Tetracentron sinense]|uniref:Uncharacterized protein n=1 Tax=Tetracentron sinense TaxID=13715 RepID=A0A834YK26_TETSI|nr:hypothetical protein HHK36_025020 [Tetracentron sinense]